MSDAVRAINAFFRDATRAEVDALLGRTVLSERQEKIFSMYYIRRQNIGFIADTLGASYSVVKREVQEIRRKLLKSL